MSHHHCFAIVLAGGRGARLGGRSKADIDLGGRLLDTILSSLRNLADAVVVVAPDVVAVPPGTIRTMEDPPGGGPLAGIGAGLAALPQPADATDLVVVTSVDAPGFASIVGDLVSEARTAASEGYNGAITLGGSPKPFDQYLQGVYSREALASALGAVAREQGTLHGYGVRRALSGLKLRRIEVEESVCRDIDTPEDLAYWQRR